jgi:hypothetical protein
VAAEHDDRRAAQTVREVAREVLTCAPADAVGAEEPSHAAHLIGAGSRRGGFDRSAEHIEQPEGAAVDLVADWLDVLDRGLALSGRFQSR